MRDLELKGAITRVGENRGYYWPKVYLLAEPRMNLNQIMEFLDRDEAPEDANWWERTYPYPDGESLAEFMGRMCYGSFGAKQGKKSTREYIANIVSQKHGSVLEHACYSFLVTRCGRGFTHQCVRHRPFAFSQESTHFIDYGASSGNVFSLCGLEPRSAAADAALISMVDCVKAYKKIAADLEFKKKLRTGTARMVLPNGLESKLGFTANIRALRWFCELRGTVENTFEVRAVAVEVLRWMKSLSPAAFEALVVREAEDGLPVVVNENPETRKV
jgi:thymidylate synthase (FAD)